MKAGQITEEQINTSVIRLLEARFELGDFDPDELVPWTRIPESVIACKEHKDLALQMGREQMVLLQNRDNILPLKKDAGKIMVMGPNAADSVMLWGIYYGQPTHSVTVLEGIQAKLGKDVRYAKGCEITKLTESESIFPRLKTADGRPGVSARFWNNTKMEGKPVYETTYATAIHFDNGGNTAFAPGVNLSDFTLSMNGSFTADKDGTLDIIRYNDDGFRMIVNGDTIINKWRANGLWTSKDKLEVKKGQRYDIQFDYMQLKNEAVLNLDIAAVRNVTPGEIAARAKDVETVIFVGGISPDLEREEAKVTEPGFDNGDRTSIELPAAQREILKALHEAGKKVVLVNCSGSAVALTPELETCDAILQAWYPGEQGGHAVADVLFGDYNPGGKLPVTFYKDDSQLPPFDEYRMAGRTYRYFRGTPLFPFGYGLSYTTFAMGAPSYNAATGKITVSVTNTGKRDGTETIQAYLRNPADKEGPIKTLRGFTRVELKAGETKTVTVDLPRPAFEWWDADTNTMRVKPGKYEVLVGTSSLDKDLKKLDVEL